MCYYILAPAYCSGRGAFPCGKFFLKTRHLITCQNPDPEVEFCSNLPHTVIVEGSEMISLNAFPIHMGSVEVSLCSHCSGHDDILTQGTILDLDTMDSPEDISEEIEDLFHEADLTVEQGSVCSSEDISEEVEDLFHDADLIVEQSSVCSEESEEFSNIDEESNSGDEIDNMNQDFFSSVGCFINFQNSSMMPLMDAEDIETQ